MPSDAIPATLTRLSVPISGLKPYGRNPRRGDLDAIIDSLHYHGQYRPIVVRARTFEVLAGNHTLAAAKVLGWSEIAATFVDVTDDEAARIVLVDNRAADLGGYDNIALLDLLQELASTEASLAGTGFDDIDMEALAALWGEPPDLDTLAEEVGEVTEDDRLVRVVIEVPPPLAEAWSLHRIGFDSDRAAFRVLLAGS